MIASLFHKIITVSGHKLGVAQEAGHQLTSFGVAVPEVRHAIGNLGSEKRTCQMNIETEVVKKRL